MTKEYRADRWVISKKRDKFSRLQTRTIFFSNLTQANSNTDYFGITVKVIKKLACLKSKKRFKV